jgi:hypothetical protein
VSEGPGAVRNLLQSMIVGFPDWRFEPGPRPHGDDFVLVELRIFCTHVGPWAGSGPTGRKRVYFDFATVMRQLGKP